MKKTLRSLSCYIPCFLVACISTGIASEKTDSHEDCYSLPKLEAKTPRKWFADYPPMQYLGSYLRTAQWRKENTPTEETLPGPTPEQQESPDLTGLSDKEILIRFDLDEILDAASRETETVQQKRLFALYLRQQSDSILRVQDAIDLHEQYWQADKLSQKHPLHRMSPSQQNYTMALDALENHDPVVRLHAARILTQDRGFYWLRSLPPKFQDELRAVIETGEPRPRPIFMPLGGPPSSIATILNAKPPPYARANSFPEYYLQPQTESTGQPDNKKLQKLKKIFDNWKKAAATAMNESLPVEQRRTAFRQIHHAKYCQAVANVRFAWLMHENELFRNDAAESCGATHDQAVPERLVSIAYDENNSIEQRIKALRGIGALPTRNSVLCILLHFYRDEDPKLREAAVAALNDIQCPEARQIARVACQDNSPRVRVAAARTLASIGGEESLAVLQELLKDKEPAVRKSALAALNQLGDIRTIQAVIPFLKDQDDQMQLLAVETLSKTLEANDAPILIPLLDDSSEKVQIRTIRGLGHLKNKSVATELLITFNDTKTEEHQVAVVEALGLLESKSAIPDLRAILNLESTPEKVQVACLAALGNMDDDEADRAIIAALDNKKIAVQLNALEQLRRLNSFPPEQKLVDLFLAGKTKAIRFAAGRALSSIASEKIAPQLKNALQHDKRPAVRSIAALLLGQIGKSDDVPVLSEALQDPDSHVVKNAIIALATIGDKKGVAPITQYLLSLRNKKPGPAIKGAEVDLEQPGVHPNACAAVWALGKLGDPAASDAILKTYPLWNALNTWNSYAEGFEALALLNERRAIPLLQNKLADSYIYRNGNQHTLAALLALGWRPAAIDEIIYLGVSHLDKDTVALLWSKAEPVLEKFAAKGPGHLNFVTTSLIQLGDRRSEKLLIRLFEKSGNKNLACIYYGSRNKALREAAVSWSKKRNFSELREPKYCLAWGSTQNLVRGRMW